MRSPIPKNIRFEILKRDAFSCQYCGSKPPDVVLEVDHIIPVSRGGQNNPDNLITSCFPCNRGKSDRQLGVVPEGLLERAERVNEMTEEAERAALSIVSAHQKIDEWAWSIAEVLHPGSASGWSKNKFNGVRNFVLKLGYAEVLDAAHIADTACVEQSRKFRYFCGICWRLVREAEQ